MNNNNSGNVKYSSVSSGDYDEDDPSKYRRGNYSSNSSRSSTSNKNSVSFTNIFGSKSDEMGGASSSSSSMMFKSMIKEQDDNLERLEESTSRLSDMSLSMSNEIDMQNRYASPSSSSPSFEPNSKQTHVTTNSVVLTITQ